MVDPGGTVYWYCLTHNKVEREGDGCADRQRLGPYATRDQAQAALAKVRERNDDWDDDPDWNDDPDPAA